MAHRQRNGQIFTGSITETAENITVNNSTFDIIAARIVDPNTGKTLTAGYYHRTDLNYKTLNVLGNFALINNSVSGVWNPKLEFQNGTVNVGGNFTIKNESSNSGMYIPTLSVALTVGGNIVFEGTRISQLYLGSSSSIINGYVDFGSISSNSLDFTYSQQTATRSFGGFKGTGKLQARSGYDISMYDGMKADTLAMEGGTFSDRGETGDIGGVTTVIANLKTRSRACDSRDDFRRVGARHGNLPPPQIKILVYKKRRLNCRLFFC